MLLSSVTGTGTLVGLFGGRLSAVACGQHQLVAVNLNSVEQRCCCFFVFTVVTVVSVASVTAIDIADLAVLLIQTIQPT